MTSFMSPLPFLSSSQPPAAMVCIKVLDYEENFSMGFYITHDDLSPKETENPSKKLKKASSSSPSSATEVAPPPLATLKLFKESCVVLNGNLLYSIGGYDDWGYKWCPNQKNTSTVYAFDMLHDSPDSTRTQLPSMKASRRSCAALVHSQRLYVFGGIDYERKGGDEIDTEIKMPDPDNHPWAEVLNLEEENSVWKPLKEPLVRFSASLRVFAILLNDKQILVGKSKGAFYIYDIETNEWSDSKYKSSPVACGKTPFLVDDDDDRYLYWLKGPILRAYSLKTYKHYRLNLPFLSDYASMLWDGSARHVPCLLHLGGREFCLFSVDEKNESGKTSTKIWCYRFEANKRKEGDKGGFENLDISMCCSPTSYIFQKPVKLCDALLLNFGTKTIQDSSWKMDTAEVKRRIK